MQVDRVTYLFIATQRGVGAGAFSAYIIHSFCTLRFPPFVNRLSRAGPGYYSTRGQWKSLLSFLGEVVCSPPCNEILARSQFGHCLPRKVFDDYQRRSSRPGNVGHSDVSLNDTHTRARAIYAIINIQFGIKSGVFASQFRGMSTFKLR